MKIPVEVQNRSLTVLGHIRMIEEIGGEDDVSYVR